MKRFSTYCLMLLLAVSCRVRAYFPSDTLWRGAIKFPMHTKSIPPVRIYYAGTIIPIDIQHGNKQITFDIPESRVRNNFNLIIIDHVDFATEQNTIKYLRAPYQSPYKLYHLEFVANKESLTAKKKADDDHAHTLDNAGYWHITEQILPEDRRIPDNAIIVCYHPHLVKSVEGGNNIELPKIILDERALTTLSEEELQDASIRFLLTSLDVDSIHARQNAYIKPDFAKKNIISMIYS